MLKEKKPVFATKSNSRYGNDEDSLVLMTANKAIRSNLSPRKALHKLAPKLQRTPASVYTRWRVLLREENGFIAKNPLENISNKEVENNDYSITMNIKAEALPRVLQTFKAAGIKVNVGID